MESLLKNSYMTFNKYLIFLLLVYGKCENIHFSNGVGLNINTKFKIVICDWLPPPPKMF